MYIKGFVYRLSHDFHADIDRDVCCHTSQPRVKANVNFFSFFCFVATEMQFLR